MITLAQLGCGYWGPNLVRSFSALSGCRMKAVVEPSADRRLFLQANFPSVAALEKMEDALTDPGIDAVVIATPAATHFELARRALEAGKHTFVEKPLALTVQEVDALTALAVQHGRTLMSGHTFLYNNAVRHVKSLLDAGELGDLRYIYGSRLNLGQLRSDVNAWWNLAVHDVAILLYWRDDAMPASISAHGMDYLQPGIEDVVFATIQWPDGVMAHIHVSWLDPGKTRRMTVVGSKKMAEFDDMADNKISIIDKGFDRVPKLGERMDFDQLNAFHYKPRSGSVLQPDIDMKEPLKVEGEHFLECIRTGQQPLSGSAHSRKVVAVMEAGQRSMKERCTVQF